MAHRPCPQHPSESIAPGWHPVCPECAGIETDLSPAAGVEHIPVEASLDTTVRRYSRADVEHCCLCGYLVDGGYYASWIRAIEVDSTYCSRPGRTPEEELARGARKRAEAMRRAFEELRDLPPPDRIAWRDPSLGSPPRGWRRAATWLLERALRAVK